MQFVLICSLFDDFTK